ncbi:heparin-binding EGF-like growth factor b [Clarias gariepinus]
MNTFRLGLVFLYCIVSLQLCGCTSRDVGAAVTARKPQPVSTGDQTPNNDTRTDDQLLDSNEDYISAEYEDDDTRVSTMSKDSVLTAIKGQGKGRARKKNSCLTEQYRNYCIHGVCRYLAELNHTSCICETGYSGDRCHLFILPVGKVAEGNSHTTALAVMAAGLSLLCFTVIGVLLALRFQKKSDISIDEKIRLQLLHSDEEKAKDTIQWFSGQNGYHPETPCPC